MTRGLTESASSLSAIAPVSGRELFRARFQRSLRNCVRRRFSVAESFGVVWMETLEEVRINDDEQAQLYDELIRWAKYELFSPVVHPCPPALFTSVSPSFQVTPDPLFQVSPGAELR